MKSIKRFALLLILILCLIPIKAKADVPYITWTKGPNGWIVDTQTAYIPDKIMQISLNKPEDLFVDKENTIYVADTGNKRIVIIEADETLREISGEPLNKPTGIFVTKDFIYVADYGLKEVLVYHKDGTLYTRFGKPEEVIFGDKTNFLPRKLAVDNRGNIYVVSEGSTSGLMQMNIHGGFLGYFGSNKTNTTLKMILQRTIFTEEQLNKLFKNIPPSVTNVNIDHQGLIYTVTEGEIENPVKKLSISGLDLFPGDMIYDYFIKDVAVDSNGNTFMISASGLILEVDSNGELLFAFGDKDTGMQRMGLVSLPMAIDVTKDGKLLVLDGSNGVIQIFRPTEFANTVHEGIALYMDGLYEESEDIWKDIRKMNSSFTLAYDALGKASFKKQDYQDAIFNYKIAENRDGYSQAFWELRNNWLENYLGTFIVIMAVIYLLYKILRRVEAVRSICQPIKEMKKRVVNYPIISRVLYSKVMLKHPLDGYYDIKFRKKGNALSATVLYVWLVALQVTDIYVTGYIFNYNIIITTNLLKEVLYVVIPVALWIVCNYLVSTISDGEGRFRDIYCGTIYALSPYLIFALPLQILSNFLTINEGFLYEFGMMGLILWSGVYLFLMVKEMHAYSFSQTVKNILITLFTILLFILIAVIFYLLFNQLRDFVISVIKEVEIRG